jgi:hypothetical protein
MAEEGDGGVVDASSNDSHDQPEAMPGPLDSATQELLVQHTRRSARLTGRVEAALDWVNAHTDSTAADYNGDVVWAASLMSGASAALVRRAIDGAEVWGLPAEGETAAQCHWVSITMTAPPSVAGGAPVVEHWVPLRDAYQLVGLGACSDSPPDFSRALGLPVFGRRHGPFVRKLSWDERKQICSGDQEWLHLLPEDTRLIRISDVPVLMEFTFARLSGVSTPADRARVLQHCEQYARQLLSSSHSHPDVQAAAPGGPWNGFHHLRVKEQRCKLAEGSSSSAAAAAAAQAEAGPLPGSKRPEGDDLSAHCASKRAKSSSEPVIVARRMTRKAAADGYIEPVDPNASKVLSELDCAGVVGRGVRVGQSTIRGRRSAWSL